MMIMVLLPVLKFWRGSFFVIKQNLLPILQKQTKINWFVHRFLWIVWIFRSEDDLVWLQGVCFFFNIFFLSTPAFVQTCVHSSMCVRMREWERTSERERGGVYICLRKRECVCVFERESWSILLHPTRSTNCQLGVWVMSGKNLLQRRWRRKVKKGYGQSREREKEANPKIWVSESGELKCVYGICIIITLDK